MANDKREKQLVDLAAHYDPSPLVVEKRETLADLLKGVAAPPPNTRYPVRWKTVFNGVLEILFLEEMEDRHLVRVIEMLRQNAFHRKEKAEIVLEKTNPHEAAFLKQRPLESWLLDTDEHYIWMMEEAVRRGIEIKPDAFWELPKRAKREKRKEKKERRHVEPDHSKEPERTGPSKRRIKL